MCGQCGQCCFVVVGQIYECYCFVGVEYQVDVVEQILFIGVGVLVVEVCVFECEFFMWVFDVYWVFGVGDGVGFGEDVEYVVCGCLGVEYE